MTGQDLGAIGSDGRVRDRGPWVFGWLVYFVVLVSGLPLVRSWPPQANSCRGLVLTPGR